MAETILRHVALAFAISVALFASGVLIGYSFNAVKIDATTRQISDMRSDVENIQLEFMYLDSMGMRHACPVLEQESARLVKKLDSFGEVLTNYEEANDFGSNFRELKDTYHFLQLRTWLLQERMKSECDNDIVTLLYFHSKNCSACMQQGYVITYVKQNLGDRLMVFALDTGWEQPIMEAMMSDIGYASAPTLVINGKSYGALDKKELAKAVCGEYDVMPEFCAREQTG
ncbi:MAG: hypothetical protein PHG85_06985 [Candidatus Altiarchaeota archaeon]|nr:hypothetical protein [Candidatus Altiarchaeota archaeon]